MKSNCIVNANYILIDEVNATDIYTITDYADSINQCDDEISESNKVIDEQLKYWKQLPQYPQKSKEWLNQRSMYIGGSESGAALGVNHYEPVYKFIWKKLETIPFTDFTAVYHGNKYEDVVIMIYEWIYNIKVDEYGFLTHKTNKILGASPDGITSNYKLDGVHNSNLERVMLEIKCPTSRKINMDVNASLMDIIPEYYYYQVQQQMEVCELEHCDFFQLKINEYGNYNEFKTDTSKECVFKSKDGKFKGAVIQLLPINVFRGITLTNPNKRLKQKIYAHAKFIHQPKLNMSAEEIKQWIIDVRNGNSPDISNDEVLKHYQIKDGYFFHCVKYWKAEYGRCKRISRDHLWMSKHGEEYEYVWSIVEFFRDNEELKDIYCAVCKSLEFSTGFYKTADINKRNQQTMDNIIKKLMSNNRSEIEEIKNIYLQTNDIGFIEH